MNNQNFRVVVRRLGLESELIWNETTEKEIKEIAEIYDHSPDSLTVALAYCYEKILSSELNCSNTLPIAFKAACGAFMIVYKDIPLDEMISSIYPEEHRFYQPVLTLVNKYIVARQAECKEVNVENALLG